MNNISTPSMRCLGRLPGTESCRYTSPLHQNPGPSFKRQTVSPSSARYATSPTPAPSAVPSSPAARYAASPTPATAAARPLQLRASQTAATAFPLQAKREEVKQELAWDLRPEAPVPAPSSSSSSRDPSRIAMLQVRGSHGLWRSLY